MNESKGVVKKEDQNMETNNNSETLLNEQLVRDSINVEDFGLKLVGNEYKTPLGRIDILTMDETGKHVPIEIKIGKATDSAVGQIMGYMKAVNASRGIILAGSFSKRVEAVCADIGVDLIPYQIDAPDTIRTSLYIDKEQYKRFLETLNVGRDKSANATICRLIDERIKQYDEQQEVDA